jgi:hypothetical protein
VSQGLVAVVFGAAVKLRPVVLVSVCVTTWEFNVETIVLQYVITYDKPSIPSVRIVNEEKKNTVKHICIIHKMQAKSMRQKKVIFLN